METRKRNKRQISFSSSESEESEPVRTISIKMKRPVKPDSPVASDVSSELSDAPSIEEEEEEEEPEEDEVMNDEEIEEELEDSEEDEEAIIRSIRQPLVDTSKKTARQKAKETGAVDHLEFLPIDKNSKVKPVLTAEEAALRKSENARKRKNQTEKKLDEEKQETINRLLNKQATKKKGAVRVGAALDSVPDEAEEGTTAVKKTRPLPLGMIRYINNKEGATVSFPEEVRGHVMLHGIYDASSVAV